jgi:transposase
MNSVGIDLHRRRSHVALIDDGGTETLSRRIVNDPQALSSCSPRSTASPRLRWRRPTARRRWSSCSREPPTRSVSPIPCGLSDRRGQGEDGRGRRADARLPLARRSCARVLHRPREVRDLRELLRHRMVLTRVRTSLKCRVDALISRYGVIPPHGDTSAREALAFLRELELRPPSRRRLDSTRRLISDLDREIDEATRQIEALSHHDERVRVLTQIRGIGRYTAMLVIAEVGDVHRFEAAQALRLGRPDADRARPRISPPASDTSQSRARGHCAGRWSSQPRWPSPAAAACDGTSSGSPRAAGARPPRSRSPASCSPSATTASETARSALSLRPSASGRDRRQRRGSRRTTTHCAAATRPRALGRARLCHDLPTRTAADLLSPRAPHGTTARPARLDDRSIPELARTAAGDRTPDQPRSIMPCLTRPAPSWMTVPELLSVVTLDRGRPSQPRMSS